MSFLLKLLSFNNGNPLLTVFFLFQISTNKSKRLPLETKNTHKKKNENRRLGFIKSLHMQQCSEIAPALHAAVFHHENTPI